MSDLVNFPDSRSGQGAPYRCTERVNVIPGYLQSPVGPEGCSVGQGGFQNAVRIVRSAGSGFPSRFGFNHHRARKAFRNQHRSHNLSFAYPPCPDVLSGPYTHGKGGFKPGRKRLLQKPVRLRSNPGLFLPGISRGPFFTVHPVPKTDYFSRTVSSAQEARGPPVTIRCQALCCVLSRPVSSPVFMFRS